MLHPIPGIFIYDQQFTEQPGQNPYEKALSFLIKCWMGHGYRTNGYKVGLEKRCAGKRTCLFTTQLAETSCLGIAGSRKAEADID